MRFALRSGTPPGPDMFGYVKPASVPAARRRLSVRAADYEQQIDDLHVRYREALDDLRSVIESAIESFGMAMVDYATDECAGDIDRLVEELDEEISDAISEARGTIIL